MTKKYDIKNLLKFFEFWKDYTQPTEFYCEGWLTRLMIFSVTDHGLKNHDLFIKQNEKYFSEALLYSPFLARSKKDPLAESFTHADSAIGEFEIGDNVQKSALKFTGNNLKIIEAKIFSEFSKKVTNANFYNQSARYIACITETIDRAGKINQLDDLNLSFFLIVPENYYNKKKSFKEMMNKRNICKTVEKRINQYDKELDYNDKKTWFESKFKKVLEKTSIKPIFYEEILVDLEDYKFAKELNEYYQKCLKYNKK